MLRKLWQIPKISSSLAARLKFANMMGEFFFPPYIQNINVSFSFLLKASGIISFMQNISSLSRPVDGQEVDEYNSRATRTLFIGNLSKDITAEKLRKHLNQFGEIIVCPFFLLYVFGLWDHFAS